MFKNNEMSIAAIVPVYNVDKWLRECVDSLVNQSLCFDEIILVDDGSTDSSGTICDEYDEKYKNITTIHTKNLGLGAARNTGIRNSKSEWLCFVDSDDYLSANAVEIIKNELSDSDIVFYNGQSFDDVSKENVNDLAYKRYMFDNDIGLCGKDYFAKAVQDKKYFETACMAAYRRNLLEKNYFQEGVLFEDVFFSLVNIWEAKRVRCVDAILYHRRYRDGSIMLSVFDDRKMHDLLGVSDSIFTYFESTENSWSSIREAVFLYTQNLSNNLLNNYELMKNANYKIDDGITKQIREAIQKGIRILVKCIDAKRILEKLELVNPQKNYGFYGIGAHTNGIIKMYEDLVGEIRAKLEFFVTNPDDGLMFMGQAVKNISEISCDYDGVIISSFVYKNDMLATINGLKTKIKIINFYDTNHIDLFSWYFDYMERLT